VHEYRLLFTALANADLDEQVQQLKNKLEGGVQAPVIALNPRRNRFSRRITIGIAAAAVGIIMYFMLQPTAKPHVNPQPLQYTCNHGERRNLQLPDGTIVSMNAGSEIKLNDNYGKATREIFLEGEAFFEVQHNKAVPFIVHTTTMDVKALGTAFNVRSYKGETKTEALLVRGLIEVTLKKDNNRKLLLRPDEKLLWTEKETNKPAIQPVKKLDNGQVKELAWVENNLAFDDESFEEIATQLNRWYNIDIQFGSDSVKQYHFTATFKKEKIERVLEILKASKKFNYTINGQTILIH
jgi:transmembrane sensor